MIDLIDPSKVELVSPTTGHIFITGNVILTWNPAIDTGSNIYRYKVEVSTTSGFSTITTSGTVSGT